MSGLRNLLRTLVQRRRFERELDDELEVCVSELHPDNKPATSANSQVLNAVGPRNPASTTVTTGTLPVLFLFKKGMVASFAEQLIPKGRWMSYDFLRYCFLRADPLRSARNPERTLVARLNASPRTARLSKWIGAPFKPYDLPAPDVHGAQLLK